VQPVRQHNVRVQRRNKNTATGSVRYESFLYVKGKLRCCEILLILVERFFRHIVDTLIEKSTVPRGEQSDPGCSYDIEQ